MRFSMSTTRASQDTVAAEVPARLEHAMMMRRLTGLRILEEEATWHLVIGSTDRKGVQEMELMTERMGCGKTGRSPEGRNGGTVRPMMRDDER